MAAQATPSNTKTSGVLVVGGGAMGLGTALQLILAGYENVTILSDKFTPDTTSDGAGASLRPGGDKPPPDADRLGKWGKATRDFLSDTRRDHGARGSGIILCSGYEFWSQNVGHPFWSDMVFGMRDVPKEEMKSIGFEAPYATFYTTYCLDVARYLAFLTSEITRLGGKFVQGRISSFGQLRHAVFQYNQAHDAPDREAAFTAIQSAARVVPLSDAVRGILRSNQHSLVVNCTGLASRSLVPDPLVYSGKGVVVLVKCPGLTHFYTHLPLVSYIIPRTHDVVIGGSVSVGDDSPGIPEGFVESIIEDAAKMIPELKHAEILRSWAGYRPGRSTVRLELVTGEEPPCAFPEPFEFSFSTPRLQSLQTKARCEEIKALEEKRLAGRSEDEIAWDSSSSLKVPIIHNYGHGGSGITLHMGCAKEVVELAKQVAKPTRTVESIE